MHTSRIDGSEIRRQAATARGSRAGRIDHEALCNRRHVFRFDQQGSARDTGHSDEPYWRGEKKGRRGGGTGAPQSRSQRRIQIKSYQKRGGGAPLRPPRKSAQNPKASDQNSSKRPTPRK